MVALLQQFLAIAGIISAMIVGAATQNARSVAVRSAPDAIVERYLEYTLPPEPIDYAVASQLLTFTLRTELEQDISFVPRTYGIQESPDHTEIIASTTTRGRAMVTVDAYYGNTIERRWRFTLVPRDNEWEITEIQPIPVP